MAILQRTHYAASLSINNVGEEVILCGWIHKSRDLGALIFADVRDRTGICQAVFDEKSGEDVLEKARSLRSEFAVAIKGTVRERDSKNPDMLTGDIEISASAVVIYSRSQTPPFAIEENSAVNDALRLKYRYLDLRRPDLQKNIMLRHKAASVTRNYFDEAGFLEIETPMLIRSTPEGARDYLVPSRVHPGKYYALPQSPQLYKQLLMLSGFDRYMQIVRCFRDEDLRADRQPEFTQIDLEMSFADQEDVMGINEGFIKRLFKETLGVDLETPFLKMTYKEAMRRFGADKPDLRFGFELKNLTGIFAGSAFSVFGNAAAEGKSVMAINADGFGDRFSRKEIDALSEFVKTYGAKGLAWMRFLSGGEVQSPILKFLSENEITAVKNAMEAKENDIVFFVADGEDVAFNSLGALRNECAKRLGILNKNDYKVLWVTQFPLFETDADGALAAKHHPFTAPMDEDIPLLDTDPALARAKAYDIVINGTEAGGGSVRIYDDKLQEKMFSLLGFSKEESWARFGFLMEAFQYGPPPHAGMAYGFDRLIMLLCGGDSIRDVIAFPKVQNAAELMTNAPDVVDKQQLDELYIKNTATEE